MKINAISMSSKEKTFLDSDSTKQFLLEVYMAAQKLKEEPENIIEAMSKNFSSKPKINENARALRSHWRLSKEFKSEGAAFIANVLRQLNQEADKYIDTQINQEFVNDVYIALQAYYSEKFISDDPSKRKFKYVDEAFTPNDLVFQRRLKFTDNEIKNYHPNEEEVVEALVNKVFTWNDTKVTRLMKQLTGEPVSITLFVLKQCLVLRNSKSFTAAVYKSLGAKESEFIGDKQIANYKRARRVLTSVNSYLVNFSDKHAKDEKIKYWLSYFPGTEKLCPYTKDLTQSEKEILFQFYREKSHNYMLKKFNDDLQESVNKEKFTRIYLETKQAEIIESIKNNWRDHTSVINSIIIMDWIGYARDIEGTKLLGLNAGKLAVIEKIERMDSQNSHKDIESKKAEKITTKLTAPQLAIIINLLADNDVFEMNKTEIANVVSKFFSTETTKDLSVDMIKKRSSPSQFLLKDLDKVSDLIADLHKGIIELKRKNLK